MAVGKECITVGKSFHYSLFFVFLQFRCMQNVVCNGLIMREIIQQIYEL